MLKEKFEEKYKLNFPLETMEKFNQVEELLQNKDTKRELVEEITGLITVTHMQQSITLILKKFFSRELLMMNFTATNKKGEKIIFENTEFCSSIKDAVKVIYKRNSTGNLIYNNKEFMGMIRITINNCKDWDGHRLLRISKKT
ncbi:uncharacterized protein [Prorops nasuta]|uniref:uncharacterized protein n=1 Tax=Prorops nasuta TaxID=863751 RepID=UPI0034CDEA86